MAMTWDQHLARLRLRTRCGELEAKTLLAEAWRMIVGEFRWSFHVAESVLVTEAAYTTGTVGVTNNSTALVFTGATLSVGWTNRRIVIDGRTEPYDITIAGAGTATLTLAAGWPGETKSGLTFTIYRDRYPLPVDCDRGRAIMLLDAGRGCELPLVQPYDLKLASASMLGDTGEPYAVAQVELAVTGSADPVAMVQLIPAPDAVYTYPVIYFKTAGNPTSGTAKPLWPVTWEDLIWRKAELLWFEEHPEKPLLPDVRQSYGFRMLQCKAQNDGGAEIRRRRSTYFGGGVRASFRVAGFTEGPDLEGN